MSSPGREPIRRLVELFDQLSSRRILLFSGKGGVGKTTIASLAALTISRDRDVVLFSTDPASNLSDLFPASYQRPRLTIESIDADSLWKRFLSGHLDQFVELGDRGTYLDRDEIRRIFELSIPGIDELMGWMRIGELAEENPDASVIVDTAPTGHALRLLASSAHFESLSRALEEMQSKHRALVAQLTRRSTPDALDGFLETLRTQFESRRRLLRNAEVTALVPIFLAEPWVTSQTARLIEEVRSEGIAVPVAILNRSRRGCDCPLCSEMTKGELAAGVRLGIDVVPALRSCSRLDSPESLERYLEGQLFGDGEIAQREGAAMRPLALPAARLLFIAGKGGVGKTTVASSLAIQLAATESLPAVLLSVDPAHSVKDVFESIPVPPNLRVETIDTRAKWRRLRQRLGDEIEKAIGGLTSPNVSIAHDSEVLQELLGIAPPGADEIFAIMRIADLLDDPGISRVVIDTAPTGHFLRLLDLPGTAGEWAREMMRLLLRYRELVSPGALGEELLRASRDLRRIEQALTSDESAVVLVMRPEATVAAETARLRKALEERTVAIGGLVVNAVTPETSCPCDRARRASELALIGQLGGGTIVDRQSPPPLTVDALRALLPLE
ncbi:MAG TPA: TRC40/GET3/ArsA family transport-energizing ATPase [Thermoanaerobaculia bacterium]|nr:TRC40/GET3/ArsA family transport-energizing ATPase [Thermoanaerobaculia bacterium]